MPAILIVFSGLPGTGKTTIATILSKEIQAVFLRVDTIEQAFLRSKSNISPLCDAGYLTAYSIAKENLVNGLSVVVDCVNPLDITRNAWLQVSKDCEVELIEIEIQCTDVAEHRRRVEGRVPDIEGHVLPTWSAVLERAYEPWTRDRLIVDTSSASVNDSISKIQTFLKKHQLIV